MHRVRGHGLMLRRRFSSILRNSLDGQAQYFVEFRGGPYEKYRFQELLSAVQSVQLRHGLPPIDSLDSLDIRPVIGESISAIPVAVFMHLPLSETGIRELVDRSALIRRVVDVWAQGPSVDDLIDQCATRFHTHLLPSLQQANLPSHCSWRVIFSRIGRAGKSGIDAQQRSELLQRFAPMLQQLPGPVSLKNPQLQLLLLEDWHDFHEMSLGLRPPIFPYSWDSVTALQFNRNQQIVRFDQLDQATAINEIDTDEASQRQITLKTRGLEVPHRLLFGRIVAERLMSIGKTFTLKTRDFLGTTSMHPVPAQIAANLARIHDSSLVLDPFCGSCSALLLSAASGARVIGSDVALHSQDSVADQRHARFVRATGRDQTGKGIRDNFRAYSLEDKLIALVSADADLWLHDSAVVKDSVNDKDIVVGEAMFDAIITDPPYGLREQFRSAYQLPAAAQQRQHSTFDALTPLHHDSNSMTGAVESANEVSVGADVIALIFAMALRRLRSQGRLVFWLRTAEGVSAAHLTNALLQWKEVVLGKEQAQQLQFVSCGEEPISRALRWICVFERK